MIKAYYIHQGTIQSQEITADNQNLLQDALWVDLLYPSKAEEAWVESVLHLSIPSKEEMKEIELSSRLYKENGSLFMTATMIAKSDSNNPQASAVTFILTSNKLITVRYMEPLAFSLFIARLPYMEEKDYCAANILIGLIEATTDRLADILENVSQELDNYSQKIFRPKEDELTQALNYKQLLQDIGANGDLGAKARESLVSFNRLNSYFNQIYNAKLDTEEQTRLAMVSKDITALSDHTNFISNNANFLLDATLGMVNIEQNNTIKIFSVAAVIFLPPTLIASIYGMNFTVMPELNWRIGYPIAILLMLISAWLPYKYFKRRKWL